MVERRERARKMDHKEASAWIREFLVARPTATQQSILKAMESAHLYCAPGMVRGIYMEHLATKPNPLHVHPTKPNPPTNPNHDIPEAEPMDPKNPHDDRNKPKPNPTLPTEKESLTMAARHLVAAMRLHGIANMTVMVDDPQGTKANVQWEVEYRKRTTDSVEI